MAKCKYCNEEFSDPVINIHEEWCKEQKKETKADAKAKAEADAKAKAEADAKAKAEADAKAKK